MNSYDFKGDIVRSEESCRIGTATQTIEFTPCRARYVKLLGLSAHDKGKKAAIAELEIILEE